MSDETAVACIGGQIASELVDSTGDLCALDSDGRWIVVVDFEGTPTCLKFARWRPGTPASVAGPWRGPAVNRYVSSLGRDSYVAAVASVREGIAAGTLYQANICRIMSAPILEGTGGDVLGLAALLAQRNPAPYASCVRVPHLGIEIASASPELFIGRSGSTITSGPIKGTGAVASDLSAKDRAENIMIVDLVRNDLSKVAQPGSVAVPSLLRVEEHPTVVHLVSTVSAQLLTGIGWPEIMQATFPPGSVSGAPKFTALKMIEDLEPMARGPYCGAIGFVDADNRSASLAVGIRTFWLTDGQRNKVLHFGTGAGITWGSDPQAEWEESELKARHLTSVAAGVWT
ncbi:MAG: chorismate-binding protein [Candidatus Nanopelagicales bacterium]